MLIKLLVAALLFLALMFIGLVWLVAILAKITLWLPGGVTAFFVVIVLSVLVGRRLHARNAARGLERALRDQGKAQIKHARPDLQPDVQQLQTDFEEAVSALKDSRLGQKGRDALYYLPWYAIIGPSGAGKTTALRKSGLPFPNVGKLSGKDPKVRGLGGTRNCDWWLTNQAVLLDTAGRWSTQEEDHDEWLAFLALLRKFRAHKPLNGLITAISVGDIVNVREDEVDELAKRMRERIDEVVNHLHVSLPVYVLFTKCDLVEGFVEMFGDLRAQERDQVWGFTAPLAKDLGEAGAYFEKHFDALAETLEASSLLRIGSERKVEARQLIYAFPQQFMAMRNNLSRFMSAMFERNVYAETPSLRGVYFTSGTQEGRPFNLLLKRLVDSLGVPHGVPSTPPVVDQKSYFLRDVFMQVIFEDREVASASQAELRRRRIRRIALTSVLALFAVAFGAVPSAAFVENRNQLQSTSGLIDTWEKRETDPAAIAQKPLERIAALQSVFANLSSYQLGAPSFIGTFGMYQGGRVQPYLRRYAANLLRRELVQPAIQRDERTMADFGFRYESLPDARPTAQEASDYYSLLKLYLLLTGPKQTSEPKLDAEHRPWVSQQLAQRFCRGVDKTEAAELAQCDSLAQRYTQYATEYAELSFTRNSDAVRRTRAALTRVPLAKHALERIITRVEQEDLDLNLQRIVGHTGALTAHGSVRGAFTRRGWENIVRDLLDAHAIEHAGELWVLGLADREDSDRQLQAQLAELQTLYFQTYVEEWKAFLRTVRVEPPRDNAEALTLLSELSSGQPAPIALLIQRVYYNVQLKPKPSAEHVVENLAEGAIDSLKKKLLGSDKAQAVAKKANELGLRAEPGENRFTAADVAAAFDGFTSFAVAPDLGDQGPKPSVPYNAYNEQLFFVRDALQMQQDNPEESSQLLSRLQTARVRVRALIDEQEVGWRPLFEAILWPPVEGAASSSSAALASAAGRSFCNEIVVPFDRMIRGRYPFEQGGHDMTLDDFAKFYRPNTGILWKFTKEVLSQTVQLDGDKYTFAKKLGKDASTVYTSRLLEFLDRSDDVTTVFFAQGAAQPKVDLEVRIHPAPMVASTTIQIGGKEIEYHNGPERWQPLSWPGDDPQAGAAFVIRGANGMHERAKQEGAWGLFRLLEAGTVTRSSSSVFSVAWQLQTHDVTLVVDFRPTRSESPFFGVPGRVDKPRLLQPVRNEDALAPRSITHSGSACKP